MSTSSPTHSNKLENYVQELLSPIPAEKLTRDLPALSKYAILLEGEQINVALLLDDFAGVSQVNQRTNYTILKADDLNQPSPRASHEENALVVKIRDLPIAISCKRVETIIDLNEAKLAFHYDQTKPWSAGMIQGHWAILLDVTKLIEICG